MYFVSTISYKSPYSLQNSIAFFVSTQKTSAQGFRAHLAHLHILRLDQQELPGGGNRGRGVWPCEGQSRQARVRQELFQQEEHRLPQSVGLRLRHHGQGGGSAPVRIHRASHVGGDDRSRGTSDIQGPRRIGKAVPWGQDRDRV